MLLRSLIISVLYPFDAETRRNTAHNASDLRPGKYVRKRQRADPIWGTGSDTDAGADAGAGAGASTGTAVTSADASVEEEGSAESSVGGPSIAEEMNADAAAAGTRVDFHPHAHVIGEEGVTVQVLFSSRERSRQRRAESTIEAAAQPLVLVDFSM
jgi:hypothetical protein